MSNISEEDKLSWGDVDFIEESASFCNDPLEFKDVDEIELSEAELTPSKPKFKVIGVVKGCIAPIGELSRNGRLYESSHWGRVLSNPQLQERIAGRKFFGMISHENKRIDDTNFKAGEISHICSLLEVRNDANGKPFLYGELEILDTPAGRILKAMYEGGAGLYVSTRAAGKLLESRDGKPYKIVDSSSYYIDSIDFVLNPGFLKAKPVFEASPSESAQVSESQINELNDKTIESDLNKRQGQMYDAQANAKANPEAAAEATKKYEHALDLAQKEAERNDRILDQDEKGNHKHYKNESAEIAELNNKINQLTKIIEKVVDDVYEEEGIVEAKDAEGNEHEIIKSENKNSEHPYRLEHKVNGKTVSVSTNDFPADVKKEEEHIKNSYGIKEALPEFISLMADSNITEEVFEEILDMIKGDLK